MSATFAARSAVICMNTWAGRIEAPCRVIGETPTRWRVAVDKDTRLPGRVLKPETLALVPKAAVRFMPPSTQAKALAVCFHCAGFGGHDTFSSDGPGYQTCRICNGAGRLSS